MIKRTREYFTYYSAKERCTNPHNPGWKYYGGRGIEFRFSSFEEFFAEIGPRPKGLTLDRKDNDGHYEKGNVRWATRKEQMRNQRRNTELCRKKCRKGMATLHKNYPGLANHLRWHVRRAIVSPSCSLCQGEL